MKEKNEIEEVSYAFAIRIVKLYQYLKSQKLNYGIGDQVFRSGTSIGANIAESQYAQSTADFVLSIALKEAGETRYWIRLLHDVGYIKWMNQEPFERL